MFGNKRSEVKDGLDVTSSKRRFVTCGVNNLESVRVLYIKNVSEVKYVRTFEICEY